MNASKSITVVDDLIYKFRQALRTLQQTITGQKLIELLNTKVFIPLLMYFDNLEDQLGLKPGLIVELVQTFTDELYRGLAYSLIDDPDLRGKLLHNVEAISSRLIANQTKDTDSTYIKSVKTQRESYLTECQKAQYQWITSSLQQDKITRIYKENLKDAPDSCQDLEKKHLKDCIIKFIPFRGTESQLKKEILQFQKDLVLKKYISVVLEVIPTFQSRANTNEIIDLYKFLYAKLECNDSVEDKLKYLNCFQKTYTTLSIQQHKVLKLDLPLLVAPAPKRNSSSSSANAAQEEQPLSRFAIT